MIQTRIVKNSFARHADSYEAHGELQRAVSKNLCSFADLPAPKVLLDIGSGTGYTAIDAKERWGDISLFAVDIAYPMARKTRLAGFEKSVTADASFLPFAGGSFDLAISSLAFQWIPGIGDDGGGGAGFFSRVGSVLKKGGTLAFSTLGPGTLRELRDAYSSASLECTGIAASFPQFPGAERLARRMEEGGFICITTQTERKKVRYGSVKELFSALRGVGASAPGRPDNRPRRDVLERTGNHYPKSGDGVEATYEVIYLSGVKL